MKKEKGFKSWCYIIIPTGQKDCEWQRNNRSKCSKKLVILFLSLLLHMQFFYFFSLAFSVHEHKHLLRSISCCQRFAVNQFFLMHCMNIHLLKIIMPTVSTKKVLILYISTELPATLLHKSEQSRNLQQMHSCRTVY